MEGIVSKTKSRTGQEMNESVKKEGPQEGIQKAMA